MKKDFKNIHLGGREFPSLYRPTGRQVLLPVAADLPPTFNTQKGGDCPAWNK